MILTTVLNLTRFETNFKIVRFAVFRLEEEAGEFGFEVGGEEVLAEFFAHFALKSLLGGLAVVDMASDGCVPLAGLDVFPLWTTLEIDIALGVEHMQMDGRGGATWSHRDTRREWQSPLPCPVHR